MNVFFSDLDNTLVYSHRRAPEGEKIPVEHLDGKEQSYMTARTFSFLRDAGWLNLVPVTTRTEAQYRRLEFPEAFGIRCAIVCNGGKLLLSGREDVEWTAQTMEDAREQLESLREADGMLQELCRGELHRPEPYYVYGKAEDPARTAETLRRALPADRVTVGFDRRKVYLFAAAVNKGAAVRRFMRRFPVEHSVAAGDDPLDLPMLSAAEAALAPRSAGETGNRRILLPEGVLSDRICRALEGFHREGIL